MKVVQTLGSAQACVLREWVVVGLESAPSLPSPNISPQAVSSNLLGSNPIQSNPVVWTVVLTVTIRRSQDYIHYFNLL